MVPVKDNVVNKSRFIATCTSLTESTSEIQEFKNEFLSRALTILNPSNYSVINNLLFASAVQIDIQSILKLFLFERELE